MKKLFKSAKGFTLIELLIVIAVLGVLAGVVLVAIDPVEQLRRGRDSSRLQAVATLGHATAAHYTAQGVALSTILLPAAFTNANWQTVLQNSGDLKGPVAAPAGAAACGGGDSSQNGICYDEAGLEYFIWTIAEANSARQKGQCTAAQTVIMWYDSIRGRAGVGCVANATTAPTAATTMF